MGLFFKTCWGTIKEDILRVIHLFSNLHVENFHWLNTENIVILPKKDGAEALSHFHPISLIHGVAKLIAKMMSLRLAPFMNTLIPSPKVHSSSQEAFTTTSSTFTILLGGCIAQTRHPFFSSSISKGLLTPLDGISCLSLCNIAASRQDSGIGWRPCLSPPHPGCS
jgi:hypothetical protein